MPRVLNKHRDARTTDAVWIMRPGIWGNPFVAGRELRGRDLLCCCKPLACHGDILLEKANG